MLRGLAAAALAGCAAAQNAGITASLSEGGLNYLIQTLVPVIEAKFGSVTIPGISGEKDGFDYKLEDGVCNNFVIGSASATLTAPSTIAIVLGGVSVSCTADWSFKLKSWPHVPDGSGSADVSLSSTTADVGVTLSVANLRPTLTSSSAELHIGSIDISFHGSAWDWLLDIFKSTLEGTVKSALDSQFGTIIADFINTQGNAFLAGIPIDVPLRVRAPYNISEVRFGLTAPPDAQPSYLGLAVQGDIVPLGYPGTPPIAPPALPPFDAANGAYYIEGRFSPYTLLSAAWTYWQAGLFTFAVAPKDIPLGFNDTAAYALVAPGLPAAYPGGTVSLSLNLTALPTLTINPPADGGIAAGAQLALTFLVTPAAGGAAVPAFTLDLAAAFSMSIAVLPDPAQPGSVVFAGNLSYLHATLTAGPTSVGPVNAGLLQALVDLTLPFLLAGVNVELAKGIPLPAVDGLAFTSATTLGEQAGYVSFAANFTFTPPAAWALPAPAAAPAAATLAKAAGKATLRGSA